MERYPQDLQGLGDPGISQRSFGKDPVMMVYQKSEALNLIGDLLQGTFASKADWTM